MTGSRDWVKATRVSFECVYTTTINYSVSLDADWQDRRQPYTKNGQ